MSRGFNFVVGSLIHHKWDVSRKVAIVVDVNNDHVKILTQDGLVHSIHTSYYWSLSEINHRSSLLNE